MEEQGGDREVKEQLTGDERERHRVRRTNREEQRQREAAS